MTRLFVTGAVALLALPTAGCGGARRSESPRSARSSLLGAWHESFTRAEYVRAGADAGEASTRGNWGAFVLVFAADGRYTLARPNGPLGTPAGTYRIRGGTLIFNCTCDLNTWRYRWSVYQAELTLHRVRANSGGPTGFIVKPWSRGR